MLHKPARFRFTALFMVLSSAAILRAQPAAPIIEVHPRVATDSVKVDADDPAIWIHPTDPSKSIIIGTDKDKTNGGLYVWDLRGKQIQYVQLQRPNNVDVRYGFNLGARVADVAVVNLCRLKEIKVFAINPNDGTLTDITSTEGIKTPELDKPYGLCLYQRPADGAMFVIESSSEGESAESLHQYRLLPDGLGKVKGIYVRTFGRGTIFDKVEGLVADDELGFVYASDEEAAIRKFYADPDKGDNNEIVAFGLADGIQSDREGLAIYRCDSTTGYLLASSQKAKRPSAGRGSRGEKFSSIKVYRREGDNGNPHQHGLLFTIDTIGSLKTDGLEVTNCKISPQFPSGFIVKHHSLGRQFKLYSWEEIIQNYLKTMPTDTTTTRSKSGEY